MGRIEIEGMEFYAFHGHYEEERVVGSRFLLDIAITTGTKKAAKTDRLKYALDYQEVYRIIQEEMQKKSHLLENIANRILEALHTRFPEIKKTKLKVSKMNPPIGGKVEKVSVVMEKK